MAGGTVNPQLFCDYVRRKVIENRTLTEEETSGIFDCQGNQIPMNELYKYHGYDLSLIHI